jgi:cellulose synthase/poly-beta-1,6-N-acetylglucosamine synthase-like glycosyltransferase
MSYFHWIAGCALGLAWLWRLADAAVGVPKIADISGPGWDRKPPNNPRVSIIVPACNEAADIEATLARLLALEYDNYEVIAVDDRSMDRTGEIMERIAAAASPDRLKVIHITELPAGWESPTPCGVPVTWPAATGCFSLTPMFCSSRILSDEPWRTPNLNVPTTSSCFPA